MNMTKYEHDKSAFFPKICRSSDEVQGTQESALHQCAFDALHAGTCEASRWT